MGNNDFAKLQSQCLLHSVLPPPTIDQSSPRFCRTLWGGCWRMWVGWRPLRPFPRCAAPPWRQPSHTWRPSPGYRPLTTTARCRFEPRLIHIRSLAFFNRSVPFVRIFLIWALIWKLIRSPGIDSKKSIPPAYVARRAGTTTLFLLVPSPHRLFKNLALDTRRYHGS